MRRKIRRTCVMRPAGWRRRLRLKQAKKAEAARQSLKDLRDRMKRSRKVLAELVSQVLDYTPILNFKDNWTRGSTPKSVWERRMNRSNYFYKPKRRLVYGNWMVDA